MWCSITSMSNRRCSRIHAPVSSAMAMLSRPRMCDGGVMICIRSVADSSSASRHCRTAAANAAVGVAHRLRHAGGAGTEHQQRVGAGRRRRERPLARCDRLVEVQHRHQFGEQCLIADGVRRPAERECVLDLEALPGRADQHHGRAQPPDRPQRDHELGAVGRHQRHPVTGANTSVLEGGRHPAGHRIELCQRELAVLEGESDRVSHVSASSHTAAYASSCRTRAGAELVLRTAYHLRRIEFSYNQNLDARGVR